MPETARSNRNGINISHVKEIVVVFIQQHPDKHILLLLSYLSEKAKHPETAAIYIYIRYCCCTTTVDSLMIVNVFFGSASRNKKRWNQISEINGRKLLINRIDILFLFLFFYKKSTITSFYMLYARASHIFLVFALCSS